MWCSLEKLEIHLHLEPAHRNPRLKFFVDYQSIQYWFYKPVSYSCKQLWFRVSPPRYAQFIIRHEAGKKALAYFRSVIGKTTMVGTSQDCRSAPDT